MKTRNFVNLNMNPCKMCMPIGAVIAFKGIENSMMILHGSQGCSAYMRTHLTTHYSEPVDIASSSLHENATIYGGSNNLKKALKNVIQIYNPKVIGISTTCLAETIGEDVKRIVSEFKTENDTFGVHILTTNTPGYGGSLYEGYFTALKDIVKQVSKPSEPNNRVNVIMPHVSPGDIRNIKNLLRAFDIDFIALPDISITFDAPFSKDFNRTPEGGTKYRDIKMMSGAIATIEIGMAIPESMSPGTFLSNEYHVPLYRCPIPIGIENTDSFIQILSEISGKKPHLLITEDRGRLIDGMIDTHKVNAEIKALIYGEPDLVYSTTCLCVENGIHPTVIATGSNMSIFCDLIAQKTKTLEEKPVILDDTDFDTIESYMIEKKINLIIGNSYGKQLTEKHGIPPVRIGFPIQDRFGGQRLVYTGYNGSLKFLDDVTNTMLAKKFGTHRNIMYKKYYQKSS